MAKSKSISARGSSESVSGRRRRYLRMLSHVIVLLMLFILPELIVSMSAPGEHRRIFWPAYVNAFFYAAVFYINYYLIIPATLSRQKGPRILAFIGYNIILMVAVIALCHLFTSGYFQQHSPRRHRPAPNLSQMQIFLKFTGYYLRDCMMIILTVSLAVALKLSDNWLSLEHRRRDLAEEQKEMELSKLKSQVNPHFLFNTLNSIYSLIDIDSQAAKQAVHRLSSLLRYMLNDAPDRIPLHTEIDFIDNYIELMKLRLPDEKVIYTKDISQPDMEVPPLILICQVENAFKHADTTSRGGKIEIRLSAADNLLRLYTHNYIRTKDTRVTGTGIGLENLRRRLQLIYDSKATLEIKNDGSTFSTSLTIDNK